MQVKWFLLLLLALPISVLGIGTDTIPSIHAPKNKVRMVFNFDTRNSFIRDTKVLTLGAKIGVEFNDKWRVGLGFYFMPKSLLIDAPVPKNNLLPERANKQLKIVFNYVSVYGEYILFQNKRWELSAPLALGFGNIKTWELDSAGNEISSLKSKSVLLIEPSLSGHYKFFSWVGVGAGLGYRRIIGTDGHLEVVDSRFTRNFDSMFWNIRLKLFPSEILDVIQGKQRIWD